MYPAVVRENYANENSTARVSNVVFFMISPGQTLALIEDTLMNLIPAGVTLFF